MGGVGDFSARLELERDGNSAQTLERIDQAAIRHQMDRILKSGPFHQSHRRQRFLEYLVNGTLAGRGERLKGYNVGVEVFSVRRRLTPSPTPSCGSRPPACVKLREYYGTDGQGDTYLHRPTEGHIHTANRVSAGGITF